ncbi:MAG: type 4a pilus biogenesis protein PilO [Bacteroidota bacterium]
MKTFSTLSGKWIAAGECILFLVLGIGIVLPYGAQLLEKYQLNKLQAEQIQFMSNWRERLDTLEVTNTRYEEGIRQMVVQIPARQDFSRVIEELFSVSKTHDIKINAIVPQPVVVEHDFLKKPVQLAISGSYFDVATFINKLEQGEFLIHVVEVELEADERTRILKGELVLHVLMKGDDS